MRRAVTHFTRTWTMWSKVSAQRHTHPESPPTFFIPLNCKPSKPGLSFFFIHMYKNLFCDILLVLRIVMLFICVCENVLWKILLNVWSKEVVFSFCVLFDLHKYIPLDLQEVQHLCASSNLSSFTCVITAVRVCFDFWNMCVSSDATFYIWHHLYILHFEISVCLWDIYFG